MIKTKVLLMIYQENVVKPGEMVEVVSYDPEPATMPDDAAGKILDAVQTLVLDLKEA